MLRILDRLFGRKSVVSDALVGCWQLVAVEGQPFEPAEANFRPDGTLQYSVLSGARWQIMKLRYRVEGDVLVTDQPSAPREERTKFFLGPDGTLSLEFGGSRSLFRRGEMVAPDV
jgi:hypothetical protein